MIKADIPLYIADYLNQQFKNTSVAGITVYQVGRERFYDVMVTVENSAYTLTFNTHAALVNKNRYCA